MSLKVWLPLNGTLDNQGLDNIVVTNNGATVDNSGKIGKCYSFDGSDDYISLTGNCLYNIIKGGTSSFSISFWIYQADSTRAIIFGDYGLAGGIGFNIELTTNNCVRFYWNGSPDLGISQINVGTTTWNHVVLVYDTTHLYGYLNGNLVYTYTGYLTVKNKISGSYYLGRDSRTGSTTLNGKLNDFRIYDHALSSMEVKQISQGLILHYPLNNIGIKEDIEYDCSGYCNNGVKTGTFTYDSDTPKYNVSTVFNKASYINIGQQLFNARDEVTVNLWVKADSWTTNPGTFFSSVQSGGYGWQKSSNTYKVYCGTGISSNTYISVSLSTTSLDASKWHMMTFTYNGMVLKTYIDSVLKTTTSKYSTKTPLFFNSNTTMFIGG